VFAQADYKKINKTKHLDDCGQQIIMLANSQLQHSMGIGDRGRGAPA